MDGNDLGLIMRSLMGLLKILRVILKVLFFLGFGWFLLPVGLAMLIETVSGQPFHPDYINPVLYFLVNNVLFYLAFPLAVLTAVQNIIRMVKKDRSFSWINLIFHRKQAKGFEAELRKKNKSIVLQTPPNISGVVFGKDKNGKYVTMPETADGHILIIGGVGTGKTAAFALPTMVTWKHRVFAIDVKGELYAKTQKARPQAQVKKFDPCDRKAYGYDPFYMLRHTDDLSGEARSLALSLCPLPDDVKDPFWIKSAQNMLTGFIIYLFGQGLSFAESMKFIKSQPVKQLIALIMTDTEPGAMKAKLELSQFDGMDEKTLSGVFAEVSNHVTIFATDDRLQRALNGEGNCITPADIENGYDIFCCIEESRIDQWSDLLRMMCSQFLKSFERRPEGDNVPVLFLIDEFPRLGKLESINNGLATLRSKKIHIVLIMQSKSQMNAIYGKDKASVIMDTCSYKAILGTGDADMQEYCSRLIGTYDKAKKSSNYNADIMGIGKGQGTSQTTEEKRIIKPEEFSFLGEDVVCLFPIGYKRLKKAYYFENEYFKDKVS